jgi:hypothetical protein
MALITTTLGNMDSSLLERTDLTIDSIYEYTTVVEYRLKGEPNSDPIHRCPHVTLKLITVSSEATNVTVGINGLDLELLENASLLAFTMSMLANKELLLASDAVVLANNNLTLSSQAVIDNLLLDDCLVLADTLDLANTLAFSLAVAAKERETLASNEVVTTNEKLSLAVTKVNQAYLGNVV